MMRTFKWIHLVIIASLIIGPSAPALASVVAQVEGGPILNSTVPASTPVIDGKIGFGEWNLGNKFDFTNGFISVQNDGIRLYVLLDLLDDNGNDGGTNDYFWFTFDVDEDGVIDANLDLNYGVSPANGNMRYQFYLGPGSWTGLQPETLSSKGKGFGCFWSDGTLSISFFPFSFTCNSHRVWEFGFDLDEIGADPGDMVRIGFRVSSSSPAFTEDVPANFFNDFSNLIQVNLANVALPIANPAATISFDTDPIEVTQAIQDRDNTLSLVDDKDTAARLYIDVNGVGTAQPVIAYLYGDVGGVDLPGSPLALLYNAPTSINRAVLNNTANFALPSTWNDGNVNFKAKARTLLGAQINSGTIPLAFNAVEVPTYWYVPINTGTNASPVLISNTEMASQRSYLEAVFPLADVDWVFKPWTVIGPTTVGNTIAELNDYYTTVLLAWVLTVIFTGQQPFALPDQIYGFTPSGGGISDPTWLGANGRVARGFRGSSREGTMAHEINHNLDRSNNGTWGRHVPGGCGATGPDPNWPYANDDIQEVGFDTRMPWVDTASQDTVIPGNFPDYMSYCQSGKLPTKWISPYRWTNLFNTFALSFNSAMLQRAAQGFQTVHYITGFINPDGSGALNPALTQPGFPSTPGQEGNARLEVQDGQGSPLAVFPFNVDFLDDPEEPVQAVYINYQIPVQQGAGRIALYYNDNLVDEIVFSPSRPVVTLISPNGGEPLSIRPSAVEGVGEILTVQWTASDPDGDTLAFTLLYSPDDGTSWYPIASNLTGNSYEVDLDTIPGGDLARFRVIATDGVNTVEDETDTPFQVSDHAPVVSLAAPAFATPGTPVSFQGDATDVEDGVIPDDSLVWTEGSAVLGMGSELTLVLDPGSHTVTLSATDKDDNTSQVMTTVFIGYRTYLSILRR